MPTPLHRAAPPSVVTLGTGLLSGLARGASHGSRVVRDAWRLGRHSRTIGRRLPKTRRARCSACGADIDLRRTFRIERHGSQWCSTCYLTHGLDGQVLAARRGATGDTLLGAQPFDHRTFQQTWRPVSPGDAATAPAHADGDASEGSAGG